MKETQEIQKTKVHYGIGGWLILPILGFIGAIGYKVFDLWQVFTELGLEALRKLFIASAGPLSAAKIPVAASLIGDTLVVLSASYCLLLIYTKRKSIKNIATAHYLILLCSALAEFWADYVILKAVDPAAVMENIISFFTAAIWIPYFHLSKRVKNTFTN